MKIGSTINSLLESSQRWPLCKLVAIYFVRLYSNRNNPVVKKNLGDKGNEDFSFKLHVHYGENSSSGSGGTA